MVELEGLIDQQERRTPHRQWSAELRDLGRVNEVVGPDRQEACRSERRNQAGRPVAPDRDEQAIAAVETTSRRSIRIKGLTASTGFARSTRFTVYTGFTTLSEYTGTARVAVYTGDMWFAVYIGVPRLAGLAASRVGASRNTR